jgi:Zn-dependent protease with chaperone function
MFALRGMAVSLACFVSLYWLLSLAVICLWRNVKAWPRMTPGDLAKLLFALRTLPLVASCAITLVFAVPSFLKLEPRSIDEDLGVVPVVLGICAVFVLVVGVSRVSAAQARTSRVVAEWLDGANSLNAGAKAPTFQAGSNIPPLTLVGVCKPRVVVSSPTVAILSSNELYVAVRHEMAHVRSHDNFRKLVFRFVSFPGMAGLERAWSEAVELAADDHAVSSLGEALDLASALVKLSRLVPVEAPPAFTMGLVNAPGSVSARVERLLAWEETAGPHHRSFHWYLTLSALVSLLCVTAIYGPALTVTHQVTEWLVR